MGIYMLLNYVYMGKSANEETVASENLGLGGKVVCNLLNQANVPPNKGHKVFMDNYFTSVNLFEYLKNEKNICATGTIRKNRIPQTPISFKESEKSMKRGDDSVFCKKDDIVLTVWKDNSMVSVLSNYHSVGHCQTKRWNSKEKK